MPIWANKARSTLAAAITNAAGQSAAVQGGDGAKFVDPQGRVPSSFFPMRVVLTAVDGSGNDTGVEEIAEVTRVGDALTFTRRALEGTAAAAWGIGTVVESRATAAALQTPSGIVLARGIGRSTQALSSAMFSGAGSANSIMPGGVAFTLPAGTVVAGDRLHMKWFLGHRGTAVSTNWTFNLALQNFYALIGAPIVAPNREMFMEAHLVVIDPTSMFSATGPYGAGGFSGFLDFNSANGSQGASWNLNTTSLAFDMLAGFSSAPSGTEAVYLDHYSIELLPASLP